MNNFYTEERSKFRLSDWAKRLGETIQESLVDKKTQMRRFVFVDPMSRAETYVIRAEGMADVVVALIQTSQGDFCIYQPAIPQEVTSYKTEPPIKTRPLNDDAEMRILAESIAIFGPKDFLEWQATAVLESQAAVEWRCQSTAFVASLAKEPWTPTVSVSDDGAIKAQFGAVVAKISPEKVTIAFHGRAEDRLEVVRGALRDEHRRREDRRREAEAEEHGSPDQINLLDDEQA
jgi:hypothetical protein